MEKKNLVSKCYFLWINIGFSVWAECKTRSKKYKKCMKNNKEKSLLIILALVVFNLATYNI